MIELNVTGLKELDRKLKAFPADVQKKYIRLALRAGAKILQQQAITNVPNKTGRGTGLLSRNLEIGRTTTRGPVMTVPVDIKKVTKFYGVNRVNLRRNRAGKKYRVYGPAYYGRILEIGWTRRGVKYQYPFLLPAIKEKGQDAVDAFTNALAASMRSDYGRD